MTYPYSPPPAQRPYYPPPPRQSNNLATGGFVVALTGAVLSLIPILGVIAWIVAPVGLVLSLVGLSRSDRLGARGMAITGAILGALGLLICFLWATAFASVGSRAATTTPSYSYAAPSYTAPNYSPSLVAPPTTTSAMPSVNGPFGSGTYLVGSEIAPGQYRTDGSSFCGWSRNRDTSGEFGAIIANGIVQGPTTMTVQAGDGAIEFSGTCTWTRR